MPLDIPTQQPPNLLFPCPTSNYHIRSPLYNPPFILYYRLYSIDSDVSTFLHNLYQAELLARLATKPEMGWYARHTQELESPNHTIGSTDPTRRLLTQQATNWTQHMYKSQTTRTLTTHTHQLHKDIKSTTITNTIQTCPFCATSPRHTSLRPLLHGDSVHLHNHYTNQHITLTKHRSNVDIAHVIQALTTLLEHAPYNAHPQHTSFQTALLTALYHFDNSLYILITGTLWTNPLSSPIPTRQQHTHHSVQSSPQLCEKSLYRSLPRHDAYLHHTYELVSNLPLNNYTRDSLNIIDNLYIDILPASLHTSIKTYLTSIAQHQLTTHHENYPVTKTPPNIITLYYDKAKHNRPLKHTLNALDISGKSTLAQRYHQAWNVVSISLLQRARNIQHTIHALIYHQ